MAPVTTHMLGKMHIVELVTEAEQASHRLLKRVTQRVVIEGRPIYGRVVDGTFIVEVMGFTKPVTA